MVVEGEPTDATTSLPNGTVTFLEAPPATPDAPGQTDGRGPALEMLNCERFTDLPTVAGLLFPTELVFVSAIRRAMTGPRRSTTGLARESFRRVADPADYTA
jgi:hypothetical protein